MRGDIVRKRSYYIRLIEGVYTHTYTRINVVSINDLNNAVNYYATVLNLFMKSHCERDYRELMVF